MIDLHCHILPGLDDGAKNLEESVEMARIAETEGIKTIVATPHLFRDKFEYKDWSIIEKRRKELSNALKVKNIQVKILNGAEVHISHNLIENVRKNRNHLMLNHSSYMFVEFPSNHVFANHKELFFELMSEGITPIIAHPERNSVFARNPALLCELIQMGALAQANSYSFSGIYGRGARDAAFHLLKLNLIHFIGSDGHNKHSLAPRLLEAVTSTEVVVGKKMAKALVWDNPKAVLENKEISFFPEPVNLKEKEKKFRLNIPFFKIKK